MKVAFKILQFVKSALPWFLQKGNNTQFWTTPDGSFWMDPDNSFWTIEEGDSRHLSWIRSLIAPVQKLNDWFHTYADNIVYHLNLTGQVMYLEHYLNDLFDLELRRIWIEDGSLVLPPFLFNKADNEAPLYIYNKADNEVPFYMYRKSDYNVQEMFIVHIPAVLPLDQYLENRIRAAVNRYKQAGAIYKIVND
jgi:hypothetical protein